MVLDELRIPIALAPLAGGPFTPRLAAAVADAGGLGFVAAGYLSASDLGTRLAETRSRTDGLLGVNLFAPGTGAAERSSYADYLDQLRAFAQREGVELGEPRYSDDDWEAKLELLLGQPPRVVSFTFGCPAPELVERLHRAGAEAWVTITSPEEAGQAADAGADVVIVQGAEAGGHRASFVDRLDLPSYGLLALLALVRDAVGLPLVASGAIATADGVAAVLRAGARAAQAGTAFMLSPEAGTAEAHREALRTSDPTVLTRAFTGRLARGIRNRFTEAHTAAAPVAYPELHYVTAPMRRRAREQGDPGLINLWAGEAHALAQELPAAEIARRLASGA